QETKVTDIDSVVEKRNTNTLGSQGLFCADGAENISDNIRLDLQSLKLKSQDRSCLTAQGPISCHSRLNQVSRLVLFQIEVLKHHLQVFLHQKFCPGFRLNASVSLLWFQSRILQLVSTTSDVCRDGISVDLQTCSLRLHSETLDDLTSC
ncbi:hypothetical protein GOODEAATRI_011172, partial [Goodea atripinnis]